jgi:transketolase
MAYVLWRRHLKVAPTHTDWPDRDRFVLSGGHGSMLLYSLLHLSGYDLSIEDIKAFRQWGSRTPGHPEFRHTPGVEATTGPLGQGAANSVGMAMAEALLAGRYNRSDVTIIDHRTFALVTDGDMMEGVVTEAASLAGHLGLSKLTWLYDANDISLDGPLSLAMSEDVGLKFQAMGWNVLKVQDGDSDLGALDLAITQAKEETRRPTLIIVKTTIGFGSPNKAGTAKCHGAPLGPDEIRLTKEALGFNPDHSFFLPPEARQWTEEAVAKGEGLVRNWEERWALYAQRYPQQASELTLAWAGKLPDSALTHVKPFATGGKMATRKASGIVLNALSQGIPWLVGGDADLGSSTQTRLVGQPSFSRETPEGGNFHFGVREHAMASIANGMAYHGGVRPYVSTFFAFADYMRPAMRLAAMNHLPVVYVFTHDSIGVGEDGPTHQPVETLMSLRIIPGLDVVRPADANETAEAWIHAIQSDSTPVALVLTRQDLPILAADGRTSLLKGKLETRGDLPDALILATGSEVHIAMQAAETLSHEGLRVGVVSLSCWEAFERLDSDSRESLIPSKVRARVSVEAGITLGWERFVGDQGHSIGIDHFGASAPADILFQQFGVTTEAVAEAVRRVTRR